MAYVRDFDNDNYAANFIMKGFNKFNIRGLAEMYVTDTVTKSIKVRYGEEIYLTNDNDVRTTSEWIKKYDKKYGNRTNNNRGSLSNCQFIFTLDKATYGFVQVGSYVDKFDLLNPYMRNSNESAMKIYVFGKYYRKYITELKNLINHNSTDELYIYNIQGKRSGKDGNDVGINSVGRILERRDISSLFYNDHIKETILDHIENFFENRHIYESKSLTYKTGILLYGEGGTGKSSLAVALASKYNYNLIVIDMTTFDKLDISMLTSCINADTDKFIILLEDIDTLYQSLDREDGLDKDERAIINKMLQFLDSSSSPSDVIFLATTNHVDKLDSALLRDGRFDLKIEISNIDHPTAVEMVKSFDIEDEKTIEKIISRCAKSDGTVNPATLQNQILSYFKEVLINNETEE